MRDRCHYASITPCTPSIGAATTQAQRLNTHQPNMPHAARQDALHAVAARLATSPYPTH